MDLKDGFRRSVSLANPASQAIPAGTAAMEDAAAVVGVGSAPMARAAVQAVQAALAAAAAPGNTRQRRDCSAPPEGPAP